MKEGSWNLDEEANIMCNIICLVGSIGCLERFLEKPRVMDLPNKRVGCGKKKSKGN